MIRVYIPGTGIVMDISWYLIALVILVLIAVIGALSWLVRIVLR